MGGHPHATRQEIKRYAFIQCIHQASIKGYINKSVCEVIPPTVDIELDRGARDERGQKDKGIPPSEVAKATLMALKKMSMR